ncbi:hypothetical protein [Natrialba taiwanensis]|uniref:Uncharacterized protein n=1 Tax=Natrialba taiwanensis DSM 12281 TaxID=1230458 RepID=M0AB62_9EURY|nr:hypothetical protein [Natrialba taiwanensis]ELY94573.1 hypothetical protein C484_06362 [Natrialba taiwanensis DSM 12281]
MNAIHVIPPGDKRTLCVRKQSLDRVSSVQNLLDDPDCHGLSERHADPDTSTHRASTLTHREAHRLDEWWRHDVYKQNADSRHKDVSEVDEGWSPESELGQREVLAAHGDPDNDESQCPVDSESSDRRNLCISHS